MHVGVGSIEERGWQAVRDAEAIPALIALLPSGDDGVAARAAGAMHNLTCDQLSVRAIRRGDGLAPLVTLLRFVTGLLTLS